MWRARAREILKLTQLDALANEHAKGLSGGQKKLLELGRALRTDPTLVLLDEPVAGVNPTLAANLMDLIEKLRQGGRTFFLIEHDMNVVMNRCDRVIVMHQGRTIADGTPASVKANPLVIDSYLGGQRCSSSPSKSIPAMGKWKSSMAFRGPWTKARLLPSSSR